MTTRMHHPEHGWTHAYGDAEVAAHEANGWVVEKLTIPGERAVPVVPVTAAEAAYWINPPQKKKPGPKPKAK
jgi:hypothetical protein